MTQLHWTDDLTFHATHLHFLDNTTILDICRLSHGSCFVYYSPELLPSRNPSTNRKMIEKDRTFSRCCCFALSFYSLYYTSAASEQSRQRWVLWSRYYMSMGSWQPFYPVSCKTVRRPCTSSAAISGAVKMSRQVREQSLRRRSVSCGQ